MPTNWEDNKEIQILQEYLRIPSVHSDNERIDYGKQTMAYVYSNSVCFSYRLCLKCVLNFFLLLLRFIEQCVEFLERQAKSLDLTYNVYRLFDAKAPIVVMSWIGAQPTLPAIMLNSHMDVVPAYPEQWSHPPFAANIDENGRIYARGSQDMKGIGMQYLAAIRELKKAGQTFKRTIHVIFVPGKF